MPREYGQPHYWRVVYDTEQVTGAGGPFSDWVITSLPGATILQKWYYEQTLALHQQVADDKAVTGQDKASATASATADGNAAKSSIQAQNASVDILAEMRRAIAVPILPPTNPEVGQIWYDGSVVRVFDGVGFVPTVTISIGGRRFERGVFGVNPDGIVTVGGGFSYVLFFLNGVLLSEGEDYIAASPLITYLSPSEGDYYYIEAYSETEATSFFTKDEVNDRFLNKASRGIVSGVAPLDANKKVPEANLPALTTTATVGAATAAAASKQTPADSDFFSGVLSRGSTMFKTTWGNIKATLKFYFDGLYLGVGMLVGSRLKVAHMPHMQGGDSNGYVRITGNVIGDSATGGAMCLDTAGKFWYSFDGVNLFNISTTGVMSRVSIPASLINSGLLASERIPSLNATKVNAGVFADARIPANVGIGAGQKWVDVINQRNLSTKYKKTTGRSIQVFISYGSGGELWAGPGNSGGSTWLRLGGNPPNQNSSSVTATIPAGWFYEVYNSRWPTTRNWQDLR